MRDRLPAYIPPRITPRDEFDGYACELKLGDWSYALDVCSCVYGPGWYPFYEPVRRIEPNPTAPFTTRLVATGRYRLTSVRISPDCAFYSWRNEYVVLYPYREGHLVKARTNLYVKPVTVRSTEIGFDLREQAVILPDGIPDTLQEQAEVKGRRILDFLNRARADRRRGAGVPSKGVDHPLDPKYSAED